MAIHSSLGDDAIVQLDTDRGSEVTMRADMVMSVQLQVLRVDMTRRLFSTRLTELIDTHSGLRFGA